MSPMRGDLRETLYIVLPSPSFFVPSFESLFTCISCWDEIEFFTQINSYFCALGLHGLSTVIVRRNKSLGPGGRTVT